MLFKMMPGRALIDFAIDQEGYFETSDPTIYDAPIIIKEGIIHYAVTNMSGVEFSNSSLPHDHRYFELCTTTFN